jgi:undecaprenyl diphosphate synthase
MFNLTTVPQHVAIIMDGNSRWAKRHGLPRFEGHRIGAENAQRVVEIFAEYKIPYLTLFAFSTENWTRSKIEVRSLLQIFREMIDSELRLLHEKGIRLRHLGKMHNLPVSLRHKIEGALELTNDNTRLTLSIAFDYGGRTEITDAVRCLLADGVTSEETNEFSLKQRLYIPEIPDPDLIIRTAGEMRLSNFFLWQAAYSELYFTDALCPDFDRAEIDKALAAYDSRQRRFGGR